MKKKISLEDLLETEKSGVIAGAQSANEKSGGGKGMWKKDTDQSEWQDENTWTEKSASTSAQ